MLIVLSVHLLGVSELSYLCNPVSGPGYRRGESLLSELSVPWNVFECVAGEYVSGLVEGRLFIAVLFRWPCSDVQHSSSCLEHFTYPISIYEFDCNIAFQFLGSFIEGE